MCTPTFLAAQCTTARIGKLLKRPSVDEWIKKLRYLYPVEYDAAVKKKEDLSPLETSGRRLLCSVQQANERKTKIASSQLRVDSNELSKWVHEREPEAPKEGTDR